MAQPIVPDATATAVLQEESLRASVPDEKALMLAGLLQERVYPGQVLLFGSRARGDWTESSDIDLMVLSEEALTQSETTQLQRDLATEVQRLYAQSVYVQVFSLSHAEFYRARRAPMHLAGGAQRDGLTPAGEHMPRIVQDNPWPAVQQHLKVAQQSLHTALSNEGIAEYRTSGLSAHHALENILKAYASVLDIAYDKTHSLIDLVDGIHQQEQSIELPAREWLEDMTKLRQQGPYNADYDLFSPASEIVALVQDICGRMAHRILELSDKEPSQVGYTHWLSNRPFGGVEDANLQDYNVAEQLQQKFEAGRKVERAETLREILLDYARLYASTDRFSELVLELDRTPVESWPTLAELRNDFEESHET